MRVLFKQNIHHDYPKKLEEMSLAWYNQGRICICRKKTEHIIQKQNLYIGQMNIIIRQIWLELPNSYRKDLKEYAAAYKKRYPALRKRGNNAYSSFLMICHGLIKKYALSEEESDFVYHDLKCLLSVSSVLELIRKGLLRPVKYAYRLNCMPFSYLTGQSEYFSPFLLKENGLSLLLPTLMMVISREKAPPKLAFI